MTLKDFVVSNLGLFAWREGRRLSPGSRTGMLGIAHVIQNRVKAGQWDGDWLKVIANAHSHSASETGELHSFDLPDPWDPDWRFIIEKCEKMYDGLLADEYTWSPGFDNKTNAARPGYFYANLNQPIRQWFLDKIIKQPDNHPRVADDQPIIYFG